MVRGHLSHVLGCRRLPTQGPRKNAADFQGASEVLLEQIRKIGLMIGKHMLCLTQSATGPEQRFRRTQRKGAVRRGIRVGSRLWGRPSLCHWRAPDWPEWCWRRGVASCKDLCQVGLFLAHMGCVPLSMHFAALFVDVNWEGLFEAEALPKWVRRQSGEYVPFKNVCTLYV